MTLFVVDASVAVKWFLDEPLTDAAVRLLSFEHSRIAPALLLSEVSHALLKRHRSGELNRGQAIQALADLAELVTIVPTEHLITSGLDMAMAHDRSAYDALYLVCALDHGCQMVTADKRLYNALIQPFPHVMLWIEDLPAPGGAG